MTKKNSKQPPKLPRFSCPKDMSSKIFIDKKTKLRHRRNLKNFDCN